MDAVESSSDGQARIAAFRGGVLIVHGVRYEGELRNGKPNGSGTLTNVSGTFRGTWRDGCLQDAKQRAAFGVPLSAC